MKTIKKTFILDKEWFEGDNKFVFNY
jgi:hypothetical protein